MHVSYVVSSEELTVGTVHEVKASVLPGREKHTSGPRLDWGDQTLSLLVSDHGRQQFLTIWTAISVPWMLVFTPFLEEDFIIRELNFVLPGSSCHCDGVGAGLVCNCTTSVSQKKRKVCVNSAAGAVGSFEWGPFDEEPQISQMWDALCRIRWLASCVG